MRAVTIPGDLGGSNQMTETGARPTRAARIQPVPSNLDRRRDRGDFRRWNRRVASCLPGGSLGNYF